jgi:hypothetical protein
MKETLISTEELLELKNKAKALEGVAFILHKIKGKSIGIGCEPIENDCTLGLAMIHHLTKNKRVSESSERQVGWNLYGRIVKPENYLTTPDVFDGVEYLPTGEVFCKGDKVKKPDGKVFEITDFYWDCNKEHILCGPAHIGVRKVRLASVIGVTDDNVSLYGGETLYKVHLLDYKISSVKIGGTFSKSEYNKYFLNKEKAKEFILYDSPTLSLYEVLEYAWGNLLEDKDMKQIEEDFTKVVSDKMKPS